MLPADWTVQSNIDIADYDSKTGKSKLFNYDGVPSRAHNMARAFEEEYLGHNLLGLAFDGSPTGLSRVNKQVNLYHRERSAGKTELWRV